MKEPLENSTAAPSEVAPTKPARTGPPGGVFADRRLRIIVVAGNIESASFQQVVRAFVEPLSRRGIDVACELLPHHGGQRKALLEKVGRYDALWLHRILMPPWRMSRWRRIARRIVFSFDDPIMYSTHGWGVARRIVVAWIVTMPAAGLIAACAYWLGAAFLP